MLKGLAVLVLAMSLGADYAMACSVPFIRTFDNQTVTGTLRTKAGRPCSIHLQRSFGPMHSAEIVRRPANGSVSVGATNRVTYLPRPGFTGQDSFTYARRGRDTRNNLVVRTVRVAVTVYP